MIRSDNGDRFEGGVKRRRLSLLIAASGLTNLADSVHHLKKDGLTHTPPTLCRTGKANENITFCPKVNETETKDDTNAKLQRTFPQTLMIALVSDKAADKIQWLQDGAAFMIIKKYEFTNKVLPFFFKKTQFDSFIRKLKRWGFQRIHWGSDCGAFQHPLFHRDFPELCTRMTCVKTNMQNVGPGTEPKNETEDDFEMLQPALSRPLQVGAISKGQSKTSANNHTVPFLKTATMKQNSMPTENCKLRDDYYDYESVTLPENVFHKMNRYLPFALFPPIKRGLFDHILDFANGVYPTHAHLSTPQIYPQLFPSFPDAYSKNSHVVEPETCIPYDILIKRTQQRHGHLEKKTQMSRETLQNLGYCLNLDRC